MIYLWSFQIQIAGQAENRASSDRVDPCLVVCSSMFGHNPCWVGGSMVKPSLVKHCEWSTLVALTIVKQIPRKVHTPPPNCTKARRNKFTFEELSNPWSAKFEELSDPNFGILAGQRFTNWSRETG